MTTNDDVMVRMSDLRAAPSWNAGRGLCSGGARQIAQQCGLDWNEFLKNGLPASVLEATGNDFCIRLAAVARERAAASAGLDTAFNGVGE